MHDNIVLSALRRYNDSRKVKTELELEYSCWGEARALIGVCGEVGVGVCVCGVHIRVLSDEFLLTRKNLNI